MFAVDVRLASGHDVDKGGEATGWVIDQIGREILGPRPELSITGIESSVYSRAGSVRKWPGTQR